MTPNERYPTACPTCEGPSVTDERHPDRLCETCVQSVTDFKGRALTFMNTGASGGYKAIYNGSRENYGGHLCRLRNSVCWADEHHMGGTVVESMTVHPGALTRTNEGRFALKEGHWYALEIFDDGLGNERKTSPIRVWNVNPNGQRSWTLDFFHLDYPEGVQSKTYHLRTIHRGRSYIISVVNDGKTPRYCIFTGMTFDWFERYYRHIAEGNWIV